MSRINVRFAKTSKLLWQAYAAILVLALMLPKPAGAQSGNTGFGTGALQSDTTGDDNSAFGFDALFSNVSGIDNTAVGGKALYSNVASYNTATGYGALYSNSSGINNTADGFKALLNNTVAEYNTAQGFQSLYSVSNGSYNTAEGADTLYSNNGSSNTATGTAAIQTNQNGTDNTATGAFALRYNLGSYNTAIGSNALLNNQNGNYNVALGYYAGYNPTGSYNIDIGNEGAASDTNTIKIGVQGTQTSTYIAGIHGATIASGVAVVVDSAGQLGVKTSSARFKEAIKPMDDASEAILALKPVTFRYKKDLDPQGIPQFGLVAEQVEKVDPDLVVRDEKGQVFTVRYEAVNAMLLNEFLKEHQRVQELETRLDAMAGQMKEQARVIEEVSNKVEASQVSTAHLASYQLVPSGMTIK